MAGSGKLKGRIALVTGASRGIGRAVARRFAEEGARLILIARTQNELEKLDDEIRAIGGQASLAPLDLRDYDSIDRVGAALFERYGKLDILVGNAGILGGLGPIGHFGPKVWEDVLAVNVTANWRLIRSLDPLLRRSDAGRAIFVTSCVTQAAFPYWGAYAASKAALEMMVRVYASELGRTNVKANLIDPGVVRTSMRAEAFPGEDPASLPAPEEITETFVELALPTCIQQGKIVVACRQELPEGAK